MLRFNKSIHPGEIMKHTPLNLLSIFAATLLTASISFADDATSNSLANLHYRPAKANVLTALDFLPDAFYRSYLPATDSTSFGTHAIYPLQAAVNYGVMDNLSVGIADTYLFHSLYETERPGPFTDGSASGFSDITLNANYRYWGSLTGNMFADAIFSVSPGLGDSQGNTYPGGGNNLRGSSLYSFATTAYWVSGMQELSANGVIEYQNMANANSGTTATTTTKDSFWSGSLRGEYRYHVSSAFYADAAATFDVARTVNTNNQNISPTSVVATFRPCTLTPKLDFGYLVTPSFLVSLGANYAQNTTSAVTTRGGAVTTNVNETKTIGLDLGMKYVF
jgi:hypothetical protein